MMASISILITAILTVLLSLPLIACKVPKNDWYGIRTTQTMAGSDKEWYAVNRKGGLYLCGVGLITFAASTAFLLADPSRRAAGLWCTPLFVCLLMAAVIASLIPRNRRE
jgi:SdpI/YhfL family protein